MLKIIKDFIKQEFDIKNKPNTTYRNYIFVICMLTFAAIIINGNDQVIIFYSFIGISIFYLVIFLIFYDIKVEKKKKEIITYENNEPSEKITDLLGGFVGCSSAIIALIIALYITISLFNHVGLGMFILILLVGGGVVIPIIYAISTVISAIVTPIILFTIVVIIIYFLTH